MKLDVPDDYVPLLITALEHHYAYTRAVAQNGATTPIQGERLSLSAQACLLVDCHMQARNWRGQTPSAAMAWGAVAQNSSFKPNWMKRGLLEKSASGLLKIGFPGVRRLRAAAVV